MCSYYFFLLAIKFELESIYNCRCSEGYSGANCETQTTELSDKKGSYCL